MPLTLRRRPRVLPTEPDVGAVPHTPAPVATPSAARPDTPAPLPVAAPATRASAAPRRRARASDDWNGRFLGEVFFFGIGLSTWLANALFTVLGLTAPVGLTPISVVLSFGVHVLLSRAELHLWHRWRDPRYLALLLSCVAIDVGTTLAGLTPLLARQFPSLVGAAPTNPLDWTPLLTALMTNAALPSWWPYAALQLGIACGFALGSERLMQTFYRGMMETWHERHPLES